LCGIEVLSIIPDYAIGFVMPVLNFLKECYNRKKIRLFGGFRIAPLCEIENSNEVVDFESITARNRRSIAYFGLNSRK
jgi:hypothetical protein